MNRKYFYGGVETGIYPKFMVSVGVEKRVAMAMVVRTCPLSS